MQRGYSLRIVDWEASARIPDSGAVERQLISRGRWGGSTPRTDRVVGNDSRLETGIRDVYNERYVLSTRLANQGAGSRFVGGGG